MIIAGFKRDFIKQSKLTINIQIEVRFFSF